MSDQDSRDNFKLQSRGNENWFQTYHTKLKTIYVQRWNDVVNGGFFTWCGWLRFRRSSEPSPYTHTYKGVTKNLTSSNATLKACLSLEWGEWAIYSLHICIQHNATSFFCWVDRRNCLIVCWDIKGAISHQFWSDWMSRDSLALHLGHNVMHLDFEHLVVCYIGPLIVVFHASN